jgi:hypothetical protein
VDADLSPDGNGMSRVRAPARFSPNFAATAGKACTFCQNSPLPAPHRSAWIRFSVGAGSPNGFTSGHARGFAKAEQAVTKLQVQVEDAAGYSTGILIAGDPHRCSNHSFAALGRLESQIVLHPNETPAEVLVRDVIGTSEHETDRRFTEALLHPTGAGRECRSPPGPTFQGHKARPS